MCEWLEKLRKEFHWEKKIDRPKNQTHFLFKWSKENNSQEENPELSVSVGWDNVSAHIQTVLRKIFYKEESKRKLKIKT